MIIFGLGSGRCGTHSLAEMLNRQKDTICFHEMNPSAMSWVGAEANVLATINQFRVLMRDGISTLTTDRVVPDRSGPLARVDVKRPP